MTRDDLKNQIIDYLAGKLTCKEVTEAITDYLEGTLSFVEWVRFQMHLGLCFGCRRYLHQIPVLSVSVMIATPEIRGGSSPKAFL